ncbi:hypothetical protein [Actinomadura sp. B10D3]|uniref:hypothetical protein n=1 Tax=Actinomadura sp. B10D3 TaxID=3153557 RepID=UPI00325E965F
MPLHHRMRVLSAALLVLGLAWTGIGFFGASAWGAAGSVSGWSGSLERSAAFGRVTAVGLAAPSPVDWDEKDEELNTVDGDPGADLQWDKKTGRVRVCDREEDGHLARGVVSAGGRVLIGKKELRAAGKGHCNEAKIPNYKPGKKYSFTVCLRRSDDHPDGYCNMSDNKKWPTAERERDHCLKVWQKTYQRGDEGEGPTVKCVGGVDEYCRDFAGTGNALNWEDKCVKDLKKKLEKKILAPPKGKRKPDKYFITHRPDAEMPRGNAKKVDKVTEPVGPVLGWLVWSALGGCVLGFIVVGGRMAIRHRRGEFGGLAGELGWVFFACVIAGSGFAVVLISLLVDPL